MLPYTRSDRVSRNLKREISDIIMNRLKDPRVGFVTITDVDLTRDLKLARIFVSVLKEEVPGESIEALVIATGFIRGELGRRLKMKFIPHLEFRNDTAPQYADHIDRLLKSAQDDS